MAVARVVVAEAVAMAEAVVMIEVVVVVIMVACGNDTLLADTINSAT